MVKKMLFVIHRFGLINLYLGLLGRRPLQGDQPRLQATRRTTSPSRASTTSETTTAWDLVDDEMNTQAVITPEIMRMMGKPPKCDHNMESKLFVSHTEKNYRRLFWRCSFPRNHQCQFFQWTKEQPLQEYQAFQNQRKTQAPSSSKMGAVGRCPHLNVCRKGTNDYKIVEKCLDCQTILIERKTEKGMQKDREKLKKKLDKSVYHQESRVGGTTLTPDLARRIQESGALEIGGIWTDRMADNSESQ